MPEVHLPRRASILRTLLEVALIGVGVFLGLVGEQWRQSRGDRQQAKDALYRFQTEILANRSAIGAVKDYHATVVKSMTAYLSADANARKHLSVKMEGLRPATLEHTAWDLALATQALAHMDAGLAFGLARIYNTQQGYGDLTRGVMQSLYLHPPGNPNDNDPEAFLRAAAIYYGDITIIEPDLLKMYDEILPRIQTTLGESPAR